MELISGINEKDFGLRRSIISKVAYGKIRIDTLLPEFKILNAFGLNYQNENEADKIGKISKIIELTKDYKSFVKTIKQNSLENVWSNIKLTDQNASNVYRKSISNFFRDSSVKEGKEKFNERWLESNRNQIKTSTIKFFANIISQTQFCNSKSENELISSYDNSIDVYLMASAFFNDKKVTMKDLPANNDYIDMQHLVYLNDFNDKIISDDKIFKRVLGSIYPDKIIDSNEI